MILAPVRYALIAALIAAAIYVGYWIAQRALLWLLVMYLFVFTAGCATVAQAAPPAPPTVVSCPAIAQAGAITVYFCETDYGYFFTNSVGFMTVID